MHNEVKNIIEPKLDYSQIIEKIQNSDYLKTKRDKKDESYKYAFQYLFSNGGINKVKRG